MTPQSQDVGLCGVSSPVAAGPGWALSGHGLVSAGWPARLCCQIPAPGTQKQTQQLQLLNPPERVNLPYIMISLKLDRNPVDLFTPLYPLVSWSAGLLCYPQ